MTDSVEHVSDTAFWVAYYRWIETQRSDALFQDPLAKKLIGDRGEQLARHMGIAKAMMWSISLRTWIIDTYIEEAVSKGCDMIVNLGAGLDTRPYRLKLPADLQWVEVDFAHVIAYKNETLASDTPVCRLKRIACDLTADLTRLRVLNKLNEQAQRIFVLTEGVIPYLSNEAVRRLADDLQGQDHVVYWLTDYFSPFFYSLTASSDIRKRLERNAPFIFAPGPTPSDWTNFFANRGWEIAEMRYSGEEGRKIGRDLPSNWVGQFFMRFIPEEKLRPYRRMNGYALLHKGNSLVDI